MARNKDFKSFEQFRSEILRHAPGPWTAAVDELADEMYHTDIQEEFDSLWDTGRDD